MKRFTAHLSIVLSGMLLVLLAIDRVNSAMIFIDNDITKALIALLAISSIANGARVLTRKKPRAARLPNRRAELPPKKDHRAKSGA